MLITNREGAGKKFEDALLPDLEGAEEVAILTAYVSPDGCGRLELMQLAEQIPVRLTIGRALEEGLPARTIGFLAGSMRSPQPITGGCAPPNPPATPKYMPLNRLLEKILFGLDLRI